MALAPTARLAQAAGAQVVLVNVFRPATDTVHVHAPRANAVEYVRNERRLYLEGLVKELTGVDVDIRVEVLGIREDIDQRIAEVATDIDADMIVVVSKRVSSATGVLLGSTAQDILGRSPCPVLVVSPTVSDLRTGESQAMPLHGSTSS
jgi:nucleotide-binding universal stress UspA family protein